MLKELWHIFAYLFSIYNTDYNFFDFIFLYLTYFAIWLLKLVVVVRVVKLDNPVTLCCQGDEGYPEILRALLISFTMQLKYFSFLNQLQCQFVL